MRRRTILIGATAIGVVAAAEIIRFRHRGIQREPGLVGLWKFDEGNGDIILDSSGIGNDGTIFPAGLPDTKWGSGPFAGSISLTGAAGNHVRIAPSDSLNALVRRITVAAHVYPRSLWTPGSTAIGFAAVVQRQWGTTFHPDLFYLGYGEQNNVLHYKWSLGLNGSEPDLRSLPDGQDAPAVGRWVHLAGTYDGDSGEMTLYIDGEPIGTQKVPGQIRLDAGSWGRPLIIGAELNSDDIYATSNGFDGYVEEVRVYDHALTAAEIKALSADAARRVAAPA